MTRNIEILCETEYDCADDITGKRRIYFNPETNEYYETLAPVIPPEEPKFGPEDNLGPPRNTSEYTLDLLKIKALSGRTEVNLYRGPHSIEPAMNFPGYKSETFYFYDKNLTLVKQTDFEGAKDMFGYYTARDRRQDLHPDIHFWSIKKKEK